MVVNTACRRGHTIPDDLMGRMRASVLFLGPLLARDGAATACWPGGCALGARPIDLHIQAFQALGAQGRSWNGQLFFHAPTAVRVPDRAAHPQCGGHGERHAGRLRRPGADHS